MEEYNKIKKLNLHESVIISEIRNVIKITAMRVPNGLIYFRTQKNNNTTSTFVPFNNFEKLI